MVVERSHTYPLVDSVLVQRESSPNLLRAWQSGAHPNKAEASFATAPDQVGCTSVQHRRGLTIDVQAGPSGSSEAAWDSSAITCPSRLSGGEAPTGHSPSKAGGTFDPFGGVENEGCTPMPRCAFLSQPVAPRKSVTSSPLPSDAAAKLFPGKPHSCPPGGVARRASRPIVRVRVKRSLNLASGRVPPACQGDHGGGQQAQQQEEHEANGAGGCPAPQLGGVRKRSELFSPPMPRKFSRSMEDMVAAGIMAKLHLADGQQC